MKTCTDIQAERIHLTLVPRQQMEIMELQKGVKNTENGDHVGKYLK